MTAPRPHPLLDHLAQLQQDVAVLRDWTALLDNSLQELVNNLDRLLPTADPRSLSTTPQPLSQRVRHIRTAAGLTRAQLARIAHISVSTLRHIEHDRHPPSHKTLLRLLPALLELERALDALTDAPPPADGVPHP